MRVAQDYNGDIERINTKAKIGLLFPILGLLKLIWLILILHLLKL